MGPLQTRELHTSREGTESPCILPYYCVLQTTMWRCYDAMAADLSNGARYPIYYSNCKSRLGRQPTS